METVFGPIGDSDVIGLTASTQAFALGTMADLNPAIRLIAMNPSHLAWYLKFGTADTVTVSRTDGMRVVPGSQDKSVIIPVPAGATHVAIICEGASGDALLSYGGFDNGEFSPAGASQVIAVTTSDQRVELPALADNQPAIRLVSVASSIQSLWVKLGDVTVVGDVTSSMKIAPGNVEHPTLIPVTDGETHLSIFCEGVGGDVVLTPGGIASGINTAATSVLFSTGPRILGRTSGAGPGEELTLSQVLDFIGSATQGDILYRGASAWARLAAGTANHFLQTKGAGQNPQYAGSTVLLTSGSVSNAATLDLVLTSYTSYRSLLFSLSRFIPASDAAFWMRLSTDGGATYASGATSYRWCYRRIDVSAAVSDTGDTEDVALAITGADQVNNDHTGISCDVRLPGPFNTSDFPTVFADGTFRSNPVGTRLFQFGGDRVGTEDADAVRFMFSTGNILTGRYAVYGIF